MARRNHSRRVHSPYGNQGIGYAEGYGGEQGPGMGNAGEEMGEGGQGLAGRWEDARGTIAERPNTSVMTAFGVGFGLGLLVTLLLKREEETWFERYAPDAVQDLPDRLRHAGSKLSHQMSGSVRQAGESLASYVPSGWKRW